MDYRRFSNTYYLRVDKGEEVIEAILGLCKREGIASAIYSGIGGCASAELLTFDPKAGAFESEHLEGMLELVSLNGNVIRQDEHLRHHTHALFAYKDASGHHTRGGHLATTHVLYTAEIELRPVQDGVISYRHDPETNTGFWSFD